MGFGFLVTLLRALVSQRGWLVHRGVAIRHALVAIMSLMLLEAGSASAHDANLGSMSLSQARGVCRDVNTHPWMSGVALAQPGRWWNAKRYGTGWDLVYNDDRTKLKVFLYTYDGNGHPVWLASEMVGIDQSSGDFWKADLKEYSKDTDTDIVTGEDVGDVYFRFFRDDPSRIAMRWHWDKTSSAGLEPTAGYFEECLSDLTRLNPTYYTGSEAPVTTELFDAPKSSAPGLNQTFSGYWSDEDNVDKVPGVVMTIMQTSLGNDQDKFGEAAVWLTFNQNAEGGKRRPVFMQAQRQTLRTWLPFDTDTFDLYFHYTTDYANPYAVTDCSPNASATPPITCISNQRIGTYERTFRFDSNYRRAIVKYTIDPLALNQAGEVPNPKSTRTSVRLIGSGNMTINRMTRLQDISVNRYVCAPEPSQATCNVFVSWSGNLVGKPWKRDLGTMRYDSAPMSLEDIGVLPVAMHVGDRFQFELWSGTPGTAGAQLLDKAPEVRGVSLDSANPVSISLPDAPLISNAEDRSPHDPSVGAVAGQADVSGGAATYTIPLQVPPGRAGMQPSVSLSYSSRGGNGIAGLGWSLGAGSSIHRCPQTVAQDGATRGVRLDGADRLCLDGERLMLAPGSNTYGDVAAEYRTEIDSFAKIVQTGTSLVGAGVCFTVQQKDGRKLTYGCAASGTYCPSSGPQPSVRLQRIDGSTRELSWLLSRVEDPSGNTMDYCYIEKKELSSDQGEILLDRILYTGSTQAGLAANIASPSRRVEFDYQPRPKDGAANDRSASAIAGGMSYQAYRLSAVRTYSPDSVQPAREYRMDYLDDLVSGLDYSNYSGRSLLRGVTECAYPAAGGAPSCLKPTEFTWSDGGWDFQSRRFAVAPPGAQSPEPDEPLGDEAERSIAPRYVRNRVDAIGDIDGDGSREFWIVTSRFDGADWRAEVQLAKVTADRVTQGIVTLTGISPFARASDLDGDGIAELLAGNKIYKWKRGRGAPLCDSGATTCTAAADSYFRMVTTNLPFLNGPSPDDDENEAFALTQLVGVADFNADGAPDVLVRVIGTCDLSGGGGSGSKGTVPSGSVPLCLYLNGKPGPIDPASTAPASFSFTEAGQVGTLDAGGGSMESVQHITDFDGNGAADIVISNRNGVQRIVKLSPAPGGVSLASLGTDPNGANFVGSSRDLRWMDVNGDGLDDVVTAQTPSSPGPCGSGNCFGNWQIQLNRGGKLLAPAILSESTTAGLRYDGVSNVTTLRYFNKMIGSDIDSDGRSDLLYPAHFAARMCFDAYVSANQLIGRDSPKECPELESYGYKCLADTCAAPPPEDGNLWSQHPAENNNPKSADAFKSGLGAYDPSIYRFNAIRFVQTGENAFRVRVDETPIVSGTSVLGNQSGRVDDFFGDGLADIVSDVTCPLRASVLFPQNACHLVAAPTGGPGSPTSFLDSAQTIRLQDLVSSTTINVAINENFGDGARPGLTPTLPDLMMRAVNGLNDRAQWEYFPLSSSAGRTGSDFPLYTIDTAYVDARHFLFQSSMPVVSVMGRSNGSSGGNTGLSSTGARSQKYSYGGAMYNSQGRGFQGFRTIANEAVAGWDRVVRTTTTFHQKFPLTGRVQRVQSRIPGTTAGVYILSQEDLDWQCSLGNRTAGCPGQDGTATALNAIHWPYLNSSTKQTFDLAAAEAGATRVPLSTVTTLNGNPATSVSGWSAYGNLEYQRVTTSDGAGVAVGDKYNLASHVVTTTNTYAPPVASQWWLDKLITSRQQTSVVYHDHTNRTAPAGIELPGRIVVTTYGWNDNRTPASTQVTDQGSGTTLLTTFGYPSPNIGLPTSTTISGTDIAPTRETQIEYTTDLYFPYKATSVLSASTPSLNHATTTTVRASDGQPKLITDPNGLKTRIEYDVLGRVIERHALRSNDLASSPPVYTSVTRCNPCSGSDESLAVYYQSTVADGSPSQRAWFDVLGREVKRATRGFDGRWVNTQTRYDAMGATIQTSAPYFTGETPLLTLFTFDRLNRVRTKRAPTAELNAVQGDTLTTYTYDGLVTGIAVAPTGLSCTSSSTPVNLCLSMSRQHNALGQLMRTTDAHLGVTDYWYEALGKVAAARDANGKTTFASYNAFGHRLTSKDPNQGNWSFTYNALGELKTQTDARGVVTTVMQRDGLGRPLTQERLPPSSPPAADKGFFYDKTLDTWTYDSAGVKGQLASITRRSTTDSNANVASAPIVWQESYGYRLDTSQLDTRITSGVDMPLSSLTYKYQYDDNYGYLKGITYPNSPQPLTVWKRYTRYGALTSLTDALVMTPLWSMSEADAYGKPKQQQFGYALTEATTYSRSTGQMLHQAWRPFERPSFVGDIESIDYRHDVLGNLVSQERLWWRYELGSGQTNVLMSNLLANYRGGARETYRYDALQRLRFTDRETRQFYQNSQGSLVWDFMPVPQDQHPLLEYAYDAIGNITRKTDFADVYGYGSAASSGAVGGSSQVCGPNALSTAMSTAANISRSYKCDNNGNQVAETMSGAISGTRTVRFNGANLPAQIDNTDPYNQASLGGHVDFAYGPGNARYRRTERGSGNAVVNYYGADGYERQVASSQTVHRIELGPVVYTRVVTQTANGTTAAPSEVGYQLRDRLGSTVAIADRWGHFNGTDESAAFYTEEGLTRRFYDAFGAPTYADFGNVRNRGQKELGLEPTSWRGFTGHEHLDGARLIHMNGRMFDYRSGRFLSVDPLIQAPMNSQSFNPYSYIFNNPLSGADPSGFASVDAGSICARGAGVCGQVLGTDGLAAMKSMTVSRPTLGQITQMHVDRARAVSVGVFANGAEAGQNAAGANGNQQEEPADIGTGSPREYTVPVDGVAFATPPSLSERVHEAADASFLPHLKLAADYMDSTAELLTALKGGGNNPHTGDYMSRDEATRVIALNAALTLIGLGGRGSSVKAVLNGKTFCFAPGTIVTTVDGEKKIEDVDVGDLVLAFDTTHNEVVSRPVQELIRGLTDHWYEVTINGEVTRVTGAHRYWVVDGTDGSWTHARDLQAGMLLRQASGSLVEIESIRFIELPSLETTYNFEVDQDHNYFAGGSGTEVLVHNADPREIYFSRPPEAINESTKFQHGPWKDRTLGEAVAEAKELGRLPDGLELRATRYGYQEILVTANNRTLWVALQAALDDVPVTGLDSGTVAKDVMKHLKETGFPICPR